MQVQKRTETQYQEATSWYEGCTSITSQPIRTLQGTIKMTKDRHVDETIQKPPF